MTWFRIIGYVEGISLLLLMGVAMPLKYLAGQPLAVKIVGWIHGILFIVYVGSAFALGDKRGWTTRRMLGAFVAAVLPFGTFVFDRKLTRDGLA